MKLTSHNARADRSGLHNDRNFDLSYVSHIDISKVKDDLYWTYTGTKEKHLNEIELDYYREHFSKYLQEQNERNTQNGHSERNRTLKQFYKAKYTRPEDKIIQIGNKNEHPDAEKLWECALEYQKRFNEVFGEHCKILTMALHVDETTPHLHVRRIWSYEDEKGCERIGQTKALEKLGIMPKDPTAPETRYNNAKITFTEQDRDLLREICIEKGVELEADEPSKRPHLSDEQYKAAADEINEMERVRDNLMTEISELEDTKSELENICASCEQFFTQPEFDGIYNDEISNNRDRKLAERTKMLAQMIQKELRKAEEAVKFNDNLKNAELESEVLKYQKDIKSLQHKVEMLNSFVVQKKLGQELVDYLMEPERSQPNTTRSDDARN